MRKIKLAGLAFAIIAVAVSGSLVLAGHKADAARKSAVTIDTMALTTQTKPLPIMADVQAF